MDVPQQHGLELRRTSRTGIAINEFSEDDFDVDCNTTQSYHQINGTLESDNGSIPDITGVKHSLIPSKQTPEVSNQLREKDIKSPSQQSKISVKNVSIRTAPRRAEHITRSTFLLHYTFCFIGNGNIDWFPYKVFTYGAPFVILYCVMIFLLTIPILSLEIGLGKFTSSGPIGLTGFSSLFHGAGIAIAWMCLLIVIPENYNIATVLYYLISPSRDWVTKFDEFNNSNQTDFMSGQAYEFYNETKEALVAPVNISLIFCFLFTALSVWAMDLKIRGRKLFRHIYVVLFLFGYSIIIVLLIKCYSLSDATSHNTDFSETEAMDIFDFELWSNAAVTVFYKMDLFGIPAALASSEGFNNDLASSIAMAVFIDLSTSALFCFLAFGLLSIAEQRLGTEVLKVLVDQGFFIKYPIIFSTLESGIWFHLFLSMRFIFSMGTVIIYIDTCVLSVNDLFPASKSYRKLIRLGFCTLLVFASFVFTMPYGNGVLVVWEYEGGYHTSAVIYVVYLILLAWVYEADSFLDDIEFMRGTVPVFKFIRWKFVRSYLKYMWKFGSAPVLFTLFTYEIAKGEHALVKLGPGYQSIQILLRYSPLLVFITFAIIKLARRKGSLAQRFKDVIKPTDYWGPSDPKTNKQWHMYKDKLKSQYHNNNNVN